VALAVQARLLELLGRLLELPANLDYLLSCGQLLPSFVSATRVVLDHCNSLEADEPSMMTGGEAASRLSMLLQVRLHESWLVTRQLVCGRSSRALSSAVWDKLGP